MKFKDLPPGVLSKIGTFLDPESRISYLRAVNPIHKEPKIEKRPRYFCFFCTFNIWYWNMPMGQTLGGGEDLCFVLRNKHVSTKIEEGDDRRHYEVQKFRRRHFSEKEDQREIAWMHHYFGKT